MPKKTCHVVQQASRGFDPQASDFEVERQFHALWAQYKDKHKLGDVIPSRWTPALMKEILDLVSRGNRDPALVRCKTINRPIATGPVDKRRDRGQFSGRRAVQSARV